MNILCKKAFLTLILTLSVVTATGCGDDDAPPSSTTTTVGVVPEGAEVTTTLVHDDEFR